MTKHKDLWLGVLVFAVAAAAAGLFWSLLPAAYRENQSSDYSFVYEPVARNILAGKGITLDGELATRYPPGFSILLAGVFGGSAALGLSDETGLLLFRLFCAGMSAVLVYGLARLVWSVSPALLAAAAWLTYPFGLWLTKQPNSEVPFIPLLYAALFFLWLAVLRRPRNWWLLLLAGAFAGMAMLIRPAALLLPGVMAALVVFFDDEHKLLARLGRAALVVAAAVLVVLPWQALVASRTGEFIPLSSGGTITIQDGLTFLAVPKDYRKEVAVAPDVAEMMLNFQERRPEMEGMGDLAAVVIDEAGRDPLAFVKLMLIKLGRSWYGIDSRTFEGPVIALQIVYLALILWGSVYAVRRGGALRRMTAGNWLIVAYFWGMTILVVPLLRYMLPIMGLLMLAVPGALISARELIQGRRADRRPQAVNSDYRS